MTSGWVQFPLIYHLDVRVWLNQRSKELGRPITLSEVPDAEIEKWSASHFDAIWLMGVWQIGEQSRSLALRKAKGVRPIKYILTEGSGWG